MDGDLRGTLKQGYMMQSKYQWDFPITTYDSRTEQRKSRVSHMLELRRTEPGTEKRKEKIEMNIKEAQSASKGL